MYVSKETQGGEAGSLTGRAAQFKGGGSENSRLGTTRYKLKRTDHTQKKVEENRSCKAENVRSG